MNHSPPSYAPDDAGISLESLDFLNSGSGKSLLDAVAAVFAAGGEPSVAQVAALRKKHPAAHVHAALALGRVQEKARAKFPDLPFVWGTPEAIEQASGAPVARWKAQRFASGGATHIVDLCAGIGGDALALADVAPVTAVDLSPIRTRCLALNARAASTRHRVEILTSDLVPLLPPLPRTALFHIDPARRRSLPGHNIRRSPHYDDLIPGPDVLDSVIRHFAGGAIKLSSAADFDSLPAGHLELISYQGTVVQAVLYSGQLQFSPPAARTATVLNARTDPFSYTATPDSQITPTPPPDPLAPGHYLYELDGALTRAALAAPFARQHDLLPLTPDGGYLLSPPIPAAPPLAHPALTPFNLLALLPFSEKRLVSVLQDLPPTPPGPVEVKTRGLPELSTDTLQRRLSKASPHRRTVLLFRHGHQILAAIATRLPGS